METRRTPLKLLITGASGLYGSKLAQIALDRGITVYSSAIQNLSAYGRFVELDITNKTQVEAVFNDIKPDIVVHAASLTDVDKCETNKALAWKVNVDGTKNIIQASQKTNSFVIYISSDYIFSGDKGHYKENDTPDPVNYYGTTKMEAEEIVKNLPEYFIARPSVIYGATPTAGKVNFALWLIEALKKGERVKILTDQYNTPTLNTNLAQMTLEAAERHLTGIYHLCGSTRVSRYEFAIQLAEVFDLNKELIDKALSAQFSWPAQRPLDSSLDTTKAQQNLKCKPLELTDAFKQLKQELIQKHS